MTDPAAPSPDQGFDQDMADDSAFVASRWYYRLGAQATPDDRAVFEKWRAADPSNAAAFARVEHGAEQVQKAKDTPEILALRNETLNRLAMNRAHRGRRWLVAAGIALTLGIGSFWGLSQNIDLGGGSSSAPQIAAADVHTYHTRLGERMSVTLADGSVVHLNTQSAVRVSYTPQERRLTLESGQALFEVAKAPHRPFIVTAGDRTVTALGTKFDIRLDPSRLQIALVEGVVVVRNGSSPTEDATTLRPNEVMRLSGNQASLTQFSSLRSFISWKDGLVMFENTPLAEAVDELNRYAPRPIVIGDPRAASIKISGSFPTDKTANFLDAVQYLFPIKALNDNANNTITLRYIG